MAVTYTIEEFIRSARIGATAEELALATEKLAYSAFAVEQHAPNAPEIVANEAVSRLAAYVYDQPSIAGGVGYANAMRNSGAARVLLPYRVHRAGLSYSDNVNVVNQVLGSVGNPVVGLSVSGSTMTITFADGSTDVLTLPAGGGVPGGTADLVSGTVRHSGWADFAS